MKKILLSLVVLIICSIFIYFQLDRKLYYYGKSNFNFYQPLPFKIKPVFKNEFENEFRLEDEGGFSIASRGEHQYLGSDIKVNIKKITSYSFTEQKIYIQIEDLEGKIFFLECIKNIGNKSRQDIKINILNENTKVEPDFKLIKIDDSFFRKMELIRNYLLLAIFVMLISTVFVIRKSRIR